MVHRIEIEAFLHKALTEKTPILDVRSPGEFAKGHIPGAKNIPLFTDAERKTVGILYKQKGRQEAVLKGLDLVGPRMGQYVKRVMEDTAKRELLVHCWRGGMRSESLAWLWKTVGYQVQVLQGGYKAYRRFVHTSLKQRFKLIVLGGKTGSGKTAVLHALRARGEQIIDLEGLAHHKGSVFGAIGQLPQPTVQQFENNLYDQICQLDVEKPIWVEDESNAIGRVYIPQPFWKQMELAPAVVLDMPASVRIQRLVSEYSSGDVDELRNGLMRIKKRLGGKQLQLALDALDKSDFGVAAGVAMGYYDKTYTYALKQKSTKHITLLPISQDDPNLTATTLISLREQSIYPHD